MSDGKSGLEGTTRLDALLARNLDCSRTVARALLAEGRVEDEAGAPLTDARRKVQSPEMPLLVRVDGVPMRLEASATLMLNKPLGVVTALRDPIHPTAYDLLREAPLFPELRPVGRLDLDTSGLLLWTTEGAWIQRLTHPKREVPRTYQAALARAFQPLPRELQLEDGHRPNIAALEVIGTTDAHPSLAVPPDTRVLAQITIVGGAYHEVRRIFAALGSHVLGLCRVAFGRLELPRDLGPGAYRRVDPSEAGP